MSLPECVCSCAVNRGVQSKHLKWIHLGDLENNLLGFVQHSCLCMMQQFDDFDKIEFN